MYQRNLWPLSVDWWLAGLQLIINVLHVIVLHAQLLTYLLTLPARHNLLINYQSRLIHDYLFICRFVLFSFFFSFPFLHFPAFSWVTVTRGKTCLSVACGVSVCLVSALWIDRRSSSRKPARSAPPFCACWQCTQLKLGHARTRPRILPRKPSGARLAVLTRQVVLPAVTLRYRDHIGWNSAKIISQLISLTISLFADPNMTDLGLL